MSHLYNLEHVDRRFYVSLSSRLLMFAEDSIHISLNWLEYVPAVFLRPTSRVMDEHIFPIDRAFHFHVMPFLLVPS